MGLLNWLTGIPNKKEVRAPFCFQRAQTRARLNGELAIRSMEEQTGFQRIEYIADVNCLPPSANHQRSLIKHKHRTRPDLTALGRSIVHQEVLKRQHVREDRLTSANKSNLNVDRQASNFISPDNEDRMTNDFAASYRRTLRDTNELQRGVVATLASHFVSPSLTSLVTHASTPPDEVRRKTAEIAAQVSLFTEIAISSFDD